MIYKKRELYFDESSAIILKEGVELDIRNNTIRYPDGKLAHVSTRQRHFLLARNAPVDIELAASPGMKGQQFDAIMIDNIAELVDGKRPKRRTTVGNAGYIRMTINRLLQRK